MLLLKLHLTVFGIPEEESLGPLFMEVFVIPCMFFLHPASFSESRAPAMQTWSDLSGGTKRKAEENGRVFQVREKAHVILYEKEL